MILVQNGPQVASLEKGLLTLEDRAPDGSLVWAALPADLEWLWHWLEFLEAAGEALAAYQERARRVSS